jgi:nitrite reductase (NO-forming)
MKTSLARLNILLAMTIIALAMAGCGQSSAVAGQGEKAALTAEDVTVEFTLVTAAKEGRLLFIGVGGDIDGVVNPDLEVVVGDIVRVNLENGDGMHHDISFPDFGATSPAVIGKGDRAEVIFEVQDDKLGNYVYFCTVPGHRQAGQEGKLIVSQP